MDGQGEGSSSPRGDDPMRSTSISDKLKNLDTETQELIKSIAAEMFTTMKAQEEMAKAKKEEAKRQAKEEEARRKAKGAETSGGVDPMVADLLKQVLSKLNINQLDSSSSSSKKEYHHVPFNYPPPSMPNYAPTPSGKVPTLTIGNYDEWAEKLSFHLIRLNPSLWELVNVGPTLPKDGEEMTPKSYRELQLNA